MNPAMAEWFRRKKESGETGFGSTMATSGYGVNQVTKQQNVYDRWNQQGGTGGQGGPMGNPAQFGVGPLDPLGRPVMPRTPSPPPMKKMMGAMPQPTEGVVPPIPAPATTEQMAALTKTPMPQPQVPVNPFAAKKPKRRSPGLTTPGPLTRQGIMPTNSPLTRTPMLAKGGKVKKGGKAIVGEAGPEKLAVSKSGEATVQPMRYEDILKNLISGSYTKESTTKPAWTRTNPMTGQQEPIPGAGMVTQTRTNIQRPPYESYPAAIYSDLEQAKKELAEKQAREEEALAGLRGGMEETAQGKSAAQGTYSQRQGQIEQGNVLGAAALGQAKETVAGMPGRITETAGGLQAAAKGRTAGIIGAGERLEARTAADAERTVQGAKDARVEAITAADTLYDQGLDRVENLRTEDLDSYRDMTANAISTQRAGLDARYADMERQINAQYADNPQARDAALMQLRSAKSGEMGMLANQISVHYNDTAADLRTRYSGLLADTQTKLASLETQARTAADNMVAGVDTAMGQIKLAAGEKSLQGRIDAAQMEGALDSAALQSISWAEQNAAKMQTEIASAITNLWNNSTQFSLMNDEAREANRLNYNNLEMRGHETIANFMRSMDDSFVPLSPAMSAIMNFWSNVIQEEVALRRLA
jgi:hypothetical protein